MGRFETCPYAEISALLKFSIAYLRRGGFVTRPSSFHSAWASDWSHKEE
jgi:hypothetical protein